MNRIIALEKHILQTWQSQLQRPLRSIFRKPLALCLAVAFALASGLVPVALSKAQAAEMVPQTNTGHTNSVLALAWSLDGRSLASGSWDKTIKIWPLAQDDVLCQYVPLTREERIKIDAQKLAADSLAKNNAATAAKAAEDQRLADEAAVKRMAQQLVAEHQVAGVQAGRFNNSPAASTTTAGASGQVPSPSPASSSTVPVKDKWALIVGISEFANPEYKLRYAAKDAQDFRNFLV